MSIYIAQLSQKSLMHLSPKTSFKGFFRQTYLVCASALVFRANPSIASYNQRASSVIDKEILLVRLTIFRQRRANHSYFRKLCEISQYFGRLYSVISLDVDFIFASLVGPMKALHNSNFGSSNDLDLDTHLNIGLPLNPSGVYRGRSLADDCSVSNYRDEVMQVKQA